MCIGKPNKWDLAGDSWELGASLSGLKEPPPLWGCIKNSCHTLLGAKCHSGHGAIFMSPRWRPVENGFVGPLYITLSYHSFLPCHLLVYGVRRSPCRGPTGGVSGRWEGKSWVSWLATGQIVYLKVSLPCLAFSWLNLVAAHLKILILTVLQLRTILRLQLQRSSSSIEGHCSMA